MLNLQGSTWATLLRDLMMAAEEIKKHTKPFPLAAIGASAGGLEAITALLNHLPPKTGIAYVYIQHLDPNHESNLSSILARQTKMPVTEAIDNVKIKPDHLYVIPPNKEMSVTDGVLTVSPRPSSPYSNMPINRFFISLAEKYKESAIGIILSGTATDGTIGLKAIKTEGGLTFVQDDSAQFQSMPKSAISEGAVDLVLSPKQMAEELAKLGSEKDFYLSAIDEADSNENNEDDEAVTSILQILARSIGVDFTQYKMNTIKRRIIRRMMIYKLKSIQEYLQYFKQHTSEVDLLFQDLLINVTAFFRDNECSDYLLNDVIPKIVSSKSHNEPIRVWIPACSTGQEAYSIAILLIEALGERSGNTAIQIFATDLSETAISKARLGIYKADEVAEVSAKRLQRFFTKTDGSYRIIKSIRDLCIFATHNLAKDPPFSRLDLISCCNVLIYLDTNLQRKVISTFHYSLNPNGFLVLGKSENVGTSAYMFNQADKKHKAYTKKKDTAANPMFEMKFRQPGSNQTTLQKPTFIHKNNIEDIDLERTVDNVLLKKYTPASVVVNNDLDILQFRGSTGLYLEAAPGKASLNLMKMARPGMAFELRNIVHKAKKTGEPVKKTGLDFTIDGKAHKVSIEALPLKTDTEEEYYLVVFEEMKLAATDIDMGSLKDRRVQQLESELTALREDMKSIVESQQAANEELQSANEEIVSSNEELQSINEELETSKEEIESSNEELMTINQELQVRNEQLGESQEYSDYMFGMISESVLVLDKDLRVKSANKAFYKTFNLSETDIEGKFLNEVADKQWGSPKLKHLLMDMIHNGSEFENYELNDSFVGIGKKILLLNGKKVIQQSHNTHVYLLAMQDITEYKSPPPDE